MNISTTLSSVKSRFMENVHKGGVKNLAKAVALAILITATLSLVFFGLGLSGGGLTAAIITTAICAVAVSAYIFYIAKGKKKKHPLVDSSKLNQPEQES